MVHNAPAVIFNNDIGRIQQALDIYGNRAFLERFPPGRLLNRFPNLDNAPPEYSTAPGSAHARASPAAGVHL
jgi:hypothetical protein